MEKNQTLTQLSVLFQEVYPARFNTCMHSQPCPTLCSPRDCSPPSFLVLGIIQARILEFDSSLWE